MIIKKMIVKWLVARYLPIILEKAAVYTYRRLQVMRIERDTRRYARGDMSVSQNGFISSHK